MEIDSRFKPYLKNKPAWLRPYEDGEDLGGVSVSDEDTPGPGGYIAINPDNPQDQWYVAAAFFSTNYVPA